MHKRPSSETRDPKVRDQHAGCRNAAKLFDWMTDASDPRSRDLSGAPRLGGALPDIGCYGYLASQKTVIIVQ